jgi:hypothetical protein
VGCCSTRALVRHTAPVVFPVDFDGGEHVYRVHPIHVQLLTDPVIIVYTRSRRFRILGRNIEFGVFRLFRMRKKIFS